MTAIIILRIIAIVSCCILTTISDIKYGIISNKLIVAYGVAGISASIITCFSYSAEDQKLFLLNVGSMIVIAFILYFLRIWAGGDCKLLAVIALLYPPELYWRFGSTQCTLWYSVGLMFGIGFIYIVMESIVLWIHSGRGKLDKEALNLFKLMFFQYIKAMIYMSALFHLYSYFIVPYVRIPNP